VFSVPFAGGAATEVSTGDDYVSPNGIALGSDHNTIYVADPEAGEGVGAILVLTIDTGDVTLLAGTLNTAPRALDVLPGPSGDILYFTGLNAIDGQPGVMSIPAAGGKPTVILKGPPLVLPDGIAVDSAGTVYVADVEAAGDGLGKVFKIAGGVATPIVDPVKTGQPAGIALTVDESTLLVSAMDAATGKDEVLIVNLSTLETSIFTDVVGENTDAGGLHRARSSNDFSWCGKTAGTKGDGMVYSVTLVE
jgi:hypothetical protein